MRILILGLNYAPEQIGIAVYTSGMAEALAVAGHDIRVVAGQPYYPAWSVPEAFRGGTRETLERGVRVTRVPHYVPARPTGPRRVLHHLSFAFATARAALPMARAWRPDVVWTVAPSLIAAPVARWTARRAGVPAWLHTQDFEVEAAFVTGLLNPRSLAGSLARGLQRWAMRGFTVYSSISPQMCDRLKALGFAPGRVIEFRNWADIDRIRPLTEPSSYRAEWAITTPYVVLYSGNISNKQGIGIVVDAARRLAGRADLTFVVCGDGPQLALLRQAAADLGNIRFFPLQPAERLADLLGLATVHLLPQLPGAADLVLPSKLTNMLASGRPVVATASPGTGLAAEVEGCGIVVAPDDPEAFATAIGRLLDDGDLRASLGRAARLCAEQRWSRTAILEQFERNLRAMAAMAADPKGQMRHDAASLTSFQTHDTSSRA